jgi:Cu+-exporting ATPase
MATKEKPEETAKLMLSISNLHCSVCSGIIEKKLGKLSGIKNVAVSYLTDTMLVRYDPQKMTTTAIRELIKKMGYDTYERH